MVDKSRDFESRLMKSNLVTKSDLIEYFKRLGIQKDMIVYIQTKLHLSAYISGGNRSVFEALQEVVSYDGTIITSAFTLDNVDPLSRDYEEFQPYLCDVVRDAMPYFHKKLSLSDSDFANQMMLHDGVYRSYHPTRSFIAWGKYAKVFCEKQPLHFPLMKDSPLDLLAELNGYVVLLGYPYGEADIFKLSQTNDMKTPIRIVSSPIEKKGYKSFLPFLDYVYHESSMEEIKTMMQERKIMRETMINNSHCYFFSAKEAKVLASAYFSVYKGEY